MNFPDHALTCGPKHHFFGYYDKCPWNASGRLLLGLETDFIDRPPDPTTAASIGYVDLTANYRWHPLATTLAWNWQQGTMLQWLGRDPERLIIYNSRDADGFVAIIHDVHTGIEQRIPHPIYAVSPDGHQALSINFSRLHRHRPGYGYSGIEDPYKEDPHPTKDGIFAIDLASATNQLIISLDQIAQHTPQPSMLGASHWFNHLQFNPTGERFLFLHRWHCVQGKRHTRMFTARPDGTHLYCVAADDMVSHFDWQDAKHILAWAHQQGLGNRYFLFTDQEHTVKSIGDGILSEDGHCSYHPGAERRWLLTDTYPDTMQKRTLILYDQIKNQRYDIGRYKVLPQITGEIRCDLHPRWDRTGHQICFDSVHTGTRQIYRVDVRELII